MRKPSIQSTGYQPVPGARTRWKLLR